ncbi:hypothetical protein ACSFA0_23705 [Variovorax sp. LT1P1]|uniref:hypothetical protein n=1 Tax=Variovorax sp. LT1P1 TaxID=3443730 RepID=UPI003F45AC8D
MDLSQASSMLGSNRRRLAAVSLVVAALAPTPAFALESLLQIATTKAAEYAEVLAREAANIAAWTYDKTQNLLASQSSSESAVAAADKHLMGAKELTQAKLNYKAALASASRHQEALDKVSSDSAKGAQTCEIMDAASNASGASAETKVLAASLTTDAAQRGTSTESSEQAAADLLANYRERYCAVEDVQRGFCSTPAAPSMQGAPLHASSLLLPTANETYSTAESAAAEAFITMLTNPVPQVVLPKALDTNSVAAQRFNIALMSSQAELSVAAYSLNEIRASRVPNGSFDSTALGTSGAPISAVGLMKQLVDRKHGDPAYHARLQAMDETALLQEFTVQMAGRNWMDFYRHSQDERIEGLIATRLGVMAGERHARQLALARQKTGAGR